MFLGEQLEDVVKQLIETGDASHLKEGGKLETGVSTLPDFEKDATDRNRTSPFAFTGNKFEFRMVGSADSIASPNTTLNAIVAEAFCEAADVLEKASDFDQAVHDLIKEYMTKHQRIIFNGNGYSDEWVVEAERRGLPNIKSMIEAAETLTTDKAVSLFEKSGISIEEIFSITKIDRWFLAKLKKMAEFELALEKDGLTAGHYETGKERRSACQPHPVVRYCDDGCRYWCLSLLHFQRNGYYSARQPVCMVSDSDWHCRHCVPG